MDVLEPEVAAALRAQRGWSIKGDALVRELTFKDFEEALAFVNRVGQGAVDHMRRPDMCISEFNRVRLTLANRHHAGFTLQEVRLAEKVNAIVDEHHRGAVSHE